MSLYAQMILERGGGLCTCGEHLGVFISPAANEKATPAGWVFVPLETATEAIIDEAIACAKEGRKHWPPKEEKLPPWKPLPKEVKGGLPITGRTT